MNSILHKSENDEKHQPLVSVIVITYNSSKFVLETLVSAKAQTYENIELIVSDDASRDDTVEICRIWIEENKERFDSTELITVPENTGIPANCNRGLRAARGEWIKYIAGDDALMPNTIEHYISFAKQNNSCNLIHAQTLRYVDSFESSANSIVWQKDDILTNPKYSARDQFSLLVFSCKIEAASVIAKRCVLMDAGGFDESIPLCEDWPMWLKLTKHGHKFYYFPEPTVKYRIHSTSVYTSQKNGAFFPSFYLINRDVFNKHIKPNIGLKTRLMISYLHYVRKSFDCLNMNKKNHLYFFLYRLLHYPYKKYRSFIMNRIHRQYH